ncbi:hypothetical protein SCOR_19345 [Sulfidibacter corallicola]|uniref:DUF3857 domain-containing protein n=1 Tax=Sulfidibacter corallicola TaxID=2818388 RepID=A0A8A4TTU8_SULCO|nr:hypothetical protein [Sulfidibacter corallicola]QTD53396.1 hypothetical protein J3U87_13155 [Sulfidibacter corallicola]
MNDRMNFFRRIPNGRDILLVALCTLTVMAQPLWAQADGDVERGWHLLADKNDMTGARGAFKPGKERGETLASIGWFLSFTGNGPTQELEDAALSVMRANPGGNASEFVLKWMSENRDCLPTWGAEAAALFDENVVTNPELMAHYANMRRFSSRAQKARPPFAQIAGEAAFITDWKISNRFGHYPIPAFDHTWPAEKADWWKDARDYHTRTGVVVPPNAVSGGGVLYAFSRFDNPADQDVLFRLFTYHNASIYLNGKLLAHFPLLEEYGSNIRHLRRRLPAGSYEVVIKTTQTRGNNGQFSLQVTADKQPSFPEPGKPQTDLAGSWDKVEHIQVGLAAELEGDSSEMADFLRAILAEKDKNDEQTVSLLEKVFEKHPQSVLVGTQLSAVYMSMVKFLPQEDQLSRAFQILFTLSQLEAPNLEAKLSLALLLNRANKTRDALGLMDLVVKENPAYCEAIESLMVFSTKENLFDIRQASLRHLEDLGPNHRWAQKLLAREFNRDGNLNRTREILENLADLLPWEGYVAELHEMNENYEAAIEDLLKRWAIFEDRDYYPYAISRDYAKLGNTAKQREWLLKTLEVNSLHEEAILDLVNLNCYEGKLDAAQKLLRDYLLIEPANATFRQRLSHLEGRTAFEEFRVDSTQIIADAKNKPISEGADSELLLDQLMVRLFPDGSQMRYTHLVTRVLTKDGVDVESEVRLPGEDLEILELRTIKQDGSVFYPESFEHKSTISLSGIGVGDFIDEEHIEYLPPAYYDKDGLDGFMTFIFQGIDRIYHHSELVLIYPEELDPEPVLLARNMPEDQPQITVVDGLKYVRWLTKDMPPLHVESGMPPANYLQPVASFYYNTDWREIRDFYHHAVRLRMGLVNRLETQVDSWRALDKKPRELAQHIYEEVTDRIEPNGRFYNDVNLVWESKAGNPTLLLASVYRSLGIPCDIILCSPERMRHYTFDTPLPSLSYALLRLQFGDETLWVDANQKNLPFGYVPFSFRDSRGVLLSNGDPLFVTIPGYPDDSERVESEYRFTLNPDGSVEATGAERFFGMTAAQLVESWASLNKPETMQRVEAGINQNYPGAVVSKAGPTEDLPRGEFEITNAFSHDHLAKQVEGGLEVPFLLPKTPLLERYGQLPSRQTPIFIAQPHYNVSSLVLTLPEGMEWQNEPLKFERKAPFGDYALQVERVNERELKVSRTYHLGSQFIQPEQYQDFLVFCKAMVENEDLTFKAVKVLGAP